MTLVTSYSEVTVETGDHTSLRFLFDQISGSMGLEGIKTNYALSWRWLVEAEMQLPQVQLH